MFVFFVLFLLIPAGADGNLCWTTTEGGSYTKELPGGNILVLAELEWNNTAVTLDLIKSDGQEIVASVIKHNYLDGFFVLSSPGSAAGDHCTFYQQILLNRTDGQWSSRSPTSDGDEYSFTCSKFHAYDAQHINWSNVKRLTICQQPFARIVALTTNGESIVTCSAEGIPPLDITINGRTTSHNNSSAEVSQEVEENVSTVTCSVRSKQLKMLQSSKTVELGCVDKRGEGWIYQRSDRFSPQENILSVGIDSVDRVFVRFYYYQENGAKQIKVIEIDVPKGYSTASITASFDDGDGTFKMEISEDSPFIQFTCLSSMLHIATSSTVRSTVRSFRMKNFCEAKAVVATSSSIIETRHCRRDSFSTKMKEIPPFVGDTFQLICSSSPKIPFFKNRIIHHKKHKKDQLIAVSVNGTAVGNIEYKASSSGRYKCESFHPLLGNSSKDVTTLTIPGTVTLLPNQKLTAERTVSWTIEGYPIFDHTIKCPGLPDGYFSRKVEAVNRTRIDVTIPTDYDATTCSATFAAELGFVNKTSKQLNSFLIVLIVILVVIIIIAGIASGAVLYRKRNTPQTPSPAILVSRVSTLPREVEMVQNGYQMGHVYDSTSEWGSTQGQGSSCSFGGESTAWVPCDEEEPVYSDIGKSLEAEPVYSVVDKNKEKEPVYLVVDKSKDEEPFSSVVDESFEAEPLYSETDKSFEAEPLYSVVDKSQKEEPLYSVVDKSKNEEPVYSETDKSKEEEPLYSVVDKSQGETEYASLEFLTETPESQNEEGENVKIWVPFIANNS
eukprot:sb/3462270/